MLAGWDLAAGRENGLGFSFGMGCEERVRFLAFESSGLLVAGFAGQGSRRLPSQVLLLQRDALLGFEKGQLRARCSRVS